MVSIPSTDVTKKNRLSLVHSRAHDAEGSHGATDVDTDAIPRFIYITGCDGTGKTTQTDRLLAKLEEQGIKPERVWLRFAFLTSIPLLFYARWSGYSWSQETYGIRQGYWEFSQSWLLRNILPWLLLIDAAIMGLFRIHIPLWRGKHLVCERFALDMVADLEIAYHDPGFHQGIPGRLFPHLIPKGAEIVLLDGSPDDIAERRIDLMVDRRLEDRILGFRRLAETFGLTQLSRSASIDEISHQIWQRVVRT